MVQREYRTAVLAACLLAMPALVRAGVTPPAPPPAAFAFDETRAAIYCNGARLHSPAAMASLAPLLGERRARAFVEALPRMLPRPGYRVLVYVDRKSSYPHPFVLEAGDGVFHVYDGEVAHAVVREIASAVATGAGRRAVAGSAGTGRLPVAVLRQIVEKAK
jgi:hypothetical protein